MTMLKPSPGKSSRGVVLDGVSWATYESLLNDLGDGHTRLTYDSGKLEIMSPLRIHEHARKVIARLIEAYSDATGMGVEGLGSTTFRREDLDKGLEPDECYYIQHAPDILGKERLDLTIDPPPDLAIEIDIHPPEVARQPIYAALGVPEVWRYDGRELISLHRGTDGKYIASADSLAFPSLPMALFNQWLTVGFKQGQSAAVAELRTWMGTKL